MIWFGNDNLWVAIFEFLGTRCARSSGDTFGKGPILPGWCFQALFPVTIQMVWSMIHIDRFEHPPVNDIVHGKIHHWSVSCGFPMFFFPCHVWDLLSHATQDLRQKVKQVNLELQAMVEAKRLSSSLGPSPNGGTFSGRGWWRYRVMTSPLLGNIQPESKETNSHNGFGDEV
jgi:hypothetical protein